MAAVIQYRGCSIEGQLAEALLGVRQDLADRVAAVEAARDTARPLLQNLVTTNVVPALRGADDLLAQTSVRSARGFLQRIGVPLATATTLEAARALAPHGVVVINGKVIPLARGTNLAKIRSLYNRIDNDLAALKPLLRKGSGQFVLVVRYQADTTTVLADACGETVQTTTTDTFGDVDVPGASVATTARVPLVNLRYHVFWLNRIGATKANFIRLQGLGFLPDEIAAILAGESTSTITTTVIDDASLIDNLQTSPATLLTDADLTELLARADVPNVSTSFTSSDVSGVIRRALRRRIRSRNAAGFRSYQSTALLLAQTIDLRRSFNVDAALAQVPTNARDAAIGAVIDDAFAAGQRGLDAVASLSGDLQQVFEVMAVAENLFDTSPLDVILCLLGLDLSFGISISFDALIDLIDAFVEGVRAVIDAIIAVLSAFADLMCFLLSLLGGIIGFVNDLLACTGISVEADLPDFVSGLIAAVVEGLRAVQAMVEAIAAQLRAFLSFSISLSITAAAQANRQQVSCMSNSAILLRLTLSGL